MRIAMVGVRGVPARIGGAERVVDELARELTARGHEVLVYCRRGYVERSDKVDYATAIFTPYIPGKHLETITHTATAMTDLLCRGIDVVHIHSPGPALMSWLPALAGVPTVFTVHAPDWLRGKWSSPAKAALRMGLGLGMRLATAVTAVGKGLAAELAAKYGRHVHYVPNGVRAPQPRAPSATARWGLHNSRYLLTVGRVVPEKRLDLLLEAWAGLAAKNGTKLIVVGDVGESRYGAGCRTRAAGDVVFVGPQHGDVLQDLYASAEVVVQSSSLEGMSMVVLEAAAHGRCILAADIQANLDMMGDCIVYFHSEDTEDLRRQLSLLLHSEEMRRNFGQRAAGKVLSDYTWPAAADRMEQIYRQATLTARGEV